MKKRLIAMLLAIALIGLTGCSKADDADGSGKGKENVSSPMQSASDAIPENNDSLKNEPIQILSIKEIRPTLLGTIFSDDFHWGLGSERMAWVSSTQIVFVPENGEGQHRVFLYDTQKDAMTLLHEFSGLDRLSANGQIRSGKTAAYVYFAGPAQGRGIKMDLVTQEVTEYPLGESGYEISGREQSLAYDKEGNLAVYDISSPDTPVLLIPASEIGPLGTPSWSPDGGYILITHETGRSLGSLTQYKIFDLQGAVKFTMEAEWQQTKSKGLNWNPDGKGILIHEVTEVGTTYRFFDLESGKQRELLKVGQDRTEDHVICVTRDYAVVYSFQSPRLRLIDLGRQTTVDISSQQAVPLDIAIPPEVNIPMAYTSQDGKSILLTCDGVDADDQDVYYVIELE